MKHKFLFISFLVISLSFLSAIFLKNMARSLDDDELKEQLNGKWGDQKCTVGDIRRRNLSNNLFLVAYRRDCPNRDNESSILLEIYNENNINFPSAADSLTVLKESGVSPERNFELLTFDATKKDARITYEIIVGEIKKKVEYVISLNLTKDTVSEFLTDSPTRTILSDNSKAIREKKLKLASENEERRISALEEFYNSYLDRLVETYKQTKGSSSWADWFIANSRLELRNGVNIDNETVRGKDISVTCQKGELEIIKRGSRVETYKVQIKNLSLVNFYPFKISYICNAPGCISGDYVHGYSDKRVQGYFNELDITTDEFTIRQNIQDIFLPNIEHAFDISISEDRQKNVREYWKTKTGMTNEQIEYVAYKKHNDLKSIHKTFDRILNESCKDE